MPPEGEWMRTALVVQAALTALFAFVPPTAAHGRWLALELGIAGASAALSLALPRLGDGGLLLVVGLSCFAGVVGVGGITTGHALPGTVVAPILLLGILAARRRRPDDGAMMPSSAAEPRHGWAGQGPEPAFGESLSGGQGLEDAPREREPASSTWLPAHPPEPESAPSTWLPAHPPVERQPDLVGSPLDSPSGTPPSLPPARTILPGR